MAESINGREDYIDSREIIERIDELKAEFTDATGDDPADVMSADDWAHGLSEDDATELFGLIEFANEADWVGDWECGETFISDRCFTDYARELVEDCGYVPADLPGFIASNIDWDGVADDLKPDCTDFELFGQTFWVRA